MIASRCAALAAAAALGLAGCATTNYPSLYTAPALTTAATPAVILDQARTMQESYAASYLKLSKRNDILNVPLIGAATAGAALLFDKANPDLLFGIGLGAAVYTQGRARFEPATLAGLYAQAHEAMSCVRRNGATFAISTAQSSHDQMTQAYQNLVDARFEAELVSMQVLPAKTPDGDASVFQAAQLRLRDQITLAKATEAEATLELKAYAAAPQVLAAAVESVQRTLVTRGRSGRDTNIKELTQTLLSDGRGWTVPGANDIPKLGSTITVAAVAPSKPVSTRPVEALRALFNATQAVQRLSPGFADSLKKLDTCPMIAT